MSNHINWCINEKNCKDIVPPNISNIPGGWTKMENTSSKIIQECIDNFLITYDQKYNPILPDNIKIKIIEAASQVVNGLNIYLKFEIYSSNKDNIKPLLVKARFYLDIINKNIIVNQFSIYNRDKL